MVCAPVIHQHLPAFRSMKTDNSVQNLFSEIAQTSEFHIRFVYLHCIGVRGTVWENSLVVKTEGFSDFADTIVGKEQASRL